MTTSVQQQEMAGPGTTSVQQQVGGKRQGGTPCCSTLVVPNDHPTSCCSTLVVSSDRHPTCCSTLVVTPMRHKGLLGWKYDSRCNYMITLVTEPRSSVFGVLREWGVERSDAGRAVYEAWQAVEAKFPGVRATYNAIMPDHFHGIVYVMEEGRVSLEEVVSFFAAEAERRIGRRVWCELWRDSVCLAKGQLHRQINYVLSNAKRRWIKENNPGLFKKVMGFRHWRLERASAALAEAGDVDSWNFRPFAHDGGGRELWDLETGEEIVKPRKGNRPQRAFEEQQAYDNKGQRQQAYDNKNGRPLAASCCSTLVVPNAHSDSCCSTLVVPNDQTAPCCSTLVVPSRSIEWTAVGNPFLLDAPLLVSVRISTATPPDVIDDLVAKLGAKAERGVVLVSPWISPGEKAVKAEALARGGRVVQLLAEGMGRYYKPWGGDFDLCAEGRLLQLSPFAPREANAPRQSYGKARFEWLNLAARSLGNLATGFSREQLEETDNQQMKGK